MQVHVYPESNRRRNASAGGQVGECPAAAITIERVQVRNGFGDNMRTRCIHGDTINVKANAMQDGRRYREMGVA